ncbi:ubiquitin C-terminal hydrolase 12-like [Tasmannia lanceolata]|uniref:ubiquitin C-terminal hydrolase 12-like n=1 Tax=Tasmannia lanceolata TaxID=3420 RepID=UPI0040646DE9
MESMDELAQIIGGGVRWTIKSFSTILKSNVHYSDIFVTVNGTHITFYSSYFHLFHKRSEIFLCIADSSSLPVGWSRDVNYSFSVIDQLHNKSTLKRSSESTGRFHAGRPVLGYSSFMSFTKLQDRAKGYIMNDTCIIEAEATVLDVVPKNQGPSFMFIPTDVKEYPNSYTILVELPGLKGIYDFNVQLVDDNKAMLISGDRKREKEELVKYVTTERKFGNFSR